MTDIALSIEMIRIPAGAFLYGECEETLDLPEFWIGKTPVTNADYARFTASTDAEPPKHWGGSSTFLDGDKQSARIGLSSKNPST